MQLIVVAGNRETATDQRNLTTSYVHNGFGEVIQAISPDTGETVYEYDSAGNPVKRTDARGVVTEWTYDALGRALTMAFPDSPAEDVAYAYDDPTAGYFGIGRLASVTDDSGSTGYRYDPRGNKVWEQRVIDTQTYVTEYDYDSADRLASMSYPSGRIVDYARDALGRVVSVTTRENEFATPVTLATGGSYEPFGGLDGLTYGNGVTLALGYDLDGRLSAMDTFDGGTPILDLDYGFDLASNITGVTDAGGGGRGRGYAYDALYRLTDASGDIPTETYGYDAVGNRTSRNAEAYLYDALSNQLDSVTEGGVSRILGYSASGNTATDDRGASPDWTLAYDSTDRLVQVDEGSATLASYVHNAMGQRVAKTAGGATMHYLYGLSGNIIGEADGDTGAAQAEYVWLGRMPLAYIVTGMVYTIHANHLGTPQRVTDATKAVVWNASYRPFGEAAVSSALTFNLRFPGQYYDSETSLHYNGFRDYDPATGRYMQSDPIGLQGGWNTYAYVSGNPLTDMDLNGLTQQDIDNMVAIVWRTNPDLPSMDFGVTELNDPAHPNRTGLHRGYYKTFLGFRWRGRNEVLVDNRYLNELSCWEVISLYRTMTHELIHARDWLDGDGMRSGPEHDKGYDRVYQEAEVRTRRHTSLVRQNWDETCGQCEVEPVLPDPVF